MNFEASGRSDHEDRPSAFSARSVIITATAAVIAAAFALNTAMLGLEVWAMFLGWAAYYSRPTSTLEAVATTVSFWLGMAIGLASIIAAGALGKLLGPGAFAIVVFCVAMIVVSMRFAPFVNNLNAWFLGLSAFYAAHLGTDTIAFLKIAAAAALGVIAGLIATRLQSRVGPTTILAQSERDRDVTI